MHEHNNYLKNLPFPVTNKFREPATKSIPFISRGGSIIYMYLITNSTSSQCPNQTHF